ncbi:MAG: glycosyltransferase family 4 protein [Desulfotomaculaceae bacterium]|nr:glycosyltransferase family 4 protein [Desulfotomaculaceae bacterium]
MKQKIWMINHYAVPPQLPGGTRHYEFAKQLAARGYAVIIWLSVFHHGLRQYIDKKLINNIEGSLPERLYLRWIWSSAYSGNNWRRVINMFLFALIVLCRGLFAPRPDTIIASSPHLPAALTGWVLSKIRRSRFILEIRDLWPDGMVVLGLRVNSPVYQVLYRLAHFLYRRSPRIIVLTEGLRDALVRQGVDQEKIIFLPNGISMDYLNGAEAREITRRELGFGNKFICLYAGAHGPNNALETIVEAAGLLKKHEEMQFVLLGDGSEKKKLQAKAREMQLTNLIFLDPVPKNRVLQVLYAADAAVLSIKNLPISRGVRPNKLFDYLAAGRPIICAGYGESRTLVEELGVGVCARPEDPADLACAVARLYAAREKLSARAAEIGPAYVAEHASREIMTDLLEQVIIELEGEPAPALDVFVMTVHRWDDPRIFHKEACSLAKKYRVELHAPGEGKAFRRQGVRVCPLPRYTSRYLRPLQWWRLLIRGFSTRAKVIHLHDPELLPVGLLIKLLRRKKLVYDVHEDFAASLESKPWLPPLLRPALATALGRVEKWFARRVDALVLAEIYYEDLFPKNEVPRVGIYNYPLPDLIPATSEPGQDHVFKLIYAGGISKPRGAEQMVRALALVNWQGRDFRLLLIGPVRPPVLREELISLATSIGLAEKVIITGLLPLEAVYGHYAGADLGLCLLHPEKNYVNSLATKIFEYMAAGLPVLASNFPAWTELVQKNCCGLNVDPLDEIAIAKNMERFLNAPGMGKEMGHNGYKVFIDKYNWRIEEKKLWLLYKNLL